MKIRLLSDFHAEFYDENFGRVLKALEDKILPPLPDDKSTVLVLAGDICTATRTYMLKAIMDYLSGRFAHIIYIDGNHEHYGSDYLMTWEKIRGALEHLPNVSYGSDRSYINGRRFIYTTLWTDFDGESPHTMSAAHGMMNDYRRIAYGTRNLTPNDVLAIHKQELAFLKENTNPGDIIVTHHAPSPKSLHPDYNGHVLNGCYNTNLEDFILQAKSALWLHGHVHHHHDYMIGNTRVVCNPAGYVGERGAGYKNTMIIEV